MAGSTKNGGAGRRLCTAAPAGRRLRVKVNEEGVVQEEGAPAG